MPFKQCFSVSIVLMLMVEPASGQSLLSNRTASGRSYHVKFAPPNFMKMGLDGKPVKETKDDETGAALYQGPDDTAETNLTLATDKALARKPPLEDASHGNVKYAGFPGFPDVSDGLKKYGGTLLKIFFAVGIFSMVCVVIRGHFSPNNSEMSVALLKTTADNESWSTTTWLKRIIINMLQIVLVFSYVIVDIAGIYSLQSATGLDDDSIELATLKKLSGWKNQHYVMDSSTGVIWWMPVDGCKLPAPQPYWLDFLLGGFKAAVFYLLFKTKNVGRHPRMDYFVFYGMTAYQTLSLLYSVVMTVRGVFFTMEINTAWHKYECFGIAVNEASWDTNALMLYVKWYTVHGFAYGRQVMQIYDDLDHAKDRVLYVTMRCTFAIWGILNIGFLFTHGIVGLYVFLPVVIVIVFLVPLLTLLGLGIGSALERCLGIKQVEVEGSVIGKAIRLPAGDERDELLHKDLDGGLLTPVGGILMLGIGVQVLISEVTYAYSGMNQFSMNHFSINESINSKGWKEIVWVSVCERQSWIYLGNFGPTIMEKWNSLPGFADLLNQST